MENKSNIGLWLEGVFFLVIWAFLMTNANSSVNNEYNIFGHLILTFIMALGFWLFTNIITFGFIWLMGEAVKRFK